MTTYNTRSRSNLFRQGKVTTSDIDSSSINNIITNIVNAAYVQARQVDIYRDSGFVTNIIDSAYINSKVVIPDAGIDSASVTSIIDSAYINSKIDINTTGLSTFTKNVFTATLNQTTFNVNYIINYIDVYLNGIKLINNDDYVATNGTSVVLSTGARLDDIVEIIVWNNIPLWQEKTSNYTAIAGDRLFLDCSSNTITVTLPSSPDIGNEIRIIDVTGNASVNNITIDRNGNNILGAADNLIIQTDRAALGLVFCNATQGWVLTEK